MDFFGAQLAAAGNEVVFIARGEQYAALKANGLRVESLANPVQLESVEVFENPQETEKVDVALSCVKLYDAEHAAKICASLLSESGIAVALQNGLDGPDYLRAILGSERSLTGSVIISAFIESPGLIRHVGKTCQMALEKRAGLSENFFQVCHHAGIQVRQEVSPESILWKKFVRLAPLSGVSVLCQSPLGFVAGNSVLREVLDGLVSETVSVGRAKGVDLDESAIRQEVRERIEKAPYEFKPSLLLDIERGKKSEAAWLCGRVVQLGKELGISTPHNNTVWGAMQRFL